MYIVFKVCKWKVYAYLLCFMTHDYGTNVAFWAVDKYHSGLYHFTYLGLVSCQIINFQLNIKLRLLMHVRLQGTKQSILLHSWMEKGVLLLVNLTKRGPRHCNILSEDLEQTVSFLKCFIITSSSSDLAIIYFLGIILLLNHAFHLAFNLGKKCL